MDYSTVKPSPGINANVQNASPASLHTVDLSGFVDAVYCINLPDRKDKAELFTSQFTPRGIEQVRMLSAVDTRDSKLHPSWASHSRVRAAPGRLGNTLSYVEMLRQATESRFMTCEDDCVFSSWWCESLQNALRELDETFPSWNLLWCGYLCPDIWGVENKTHVGTHVFKASRILNTHCLIFNNIDHVSVAGQIHAHLVKSAGSLAIDSILNRVPALSQFAVTRIIAGQRGISNDSGGKAAWAPVMWWG